MAFDGITIRNLIYDMNELVGGRVNKIAQPEDYELLLTIKATNKDNAPNDNGKRMLLISANASLPFFYLTSTNKTSPLTAPGFCMLLRKHLQNSRIVSITQPGLERIIRFEFEHLNELGDLCTKYIFVEIMGKHSNIIFTDDKLVILDSIKHVSALVSSIREVLPGRKYIMPVSGGEKKDFLSETAEGFLSTLEAKSTAIYKAIYQNYTGISPVIANEICYRSGIDADASTAMLSTSLEDSKTLRQKLSETFLDIQSNLNTNEYKPSLYISKDTFRKPVEYAATSLSMYSDMEEQTFNSMSALLESYYSKKNTATNMHQKTADLRLILTNIYDRDQKKLALQRKQIEDTRDLDKYRIYGELINTYGYSLPNGAKLLTATNYYDNTEVNIPLDEQKTISENAQSYFEKYSKKKRTFEALSELTTEVETEMLHIDSILTSLLLATKNEDIDQIREEMESAGYVKRKSGSKNKAVKNKPYHYISRDGYDIYVGKNNLQNDQLTFQVATGNDWWFHAKKIPGSHVIVKTKDGELPDSVFEDAAKLAAYYSKGRDQEKVEIDYLQKKNVKKPNGAKPGFVVYYTNYSMAISPVLEGITLVE